MALLFSTVIVGCKKEDDDEATSPSKSAMLTGTWKVTAATVDPPIDFFGTPLSDLYNTFFQDCNKDDLTVFNSDKSYEFNEGETKCFSSDPQIQDQGTWALSSDGKTLTLTPDTGDVEVTMIKSLTSKTFVIEEMEYDSLQGETYTFTTTLTKQ